MWDWSTFIIFGVIFSAILFGVGYYAWVIPEQDQAKELSGRLRDLRMATRSKLRTGSDLIQRETKGSFAFLSRFFEWAGVLRRLQVMIKQADLKYKATDVLALSVISAVVVYLILGFVLDLYLLRVMLSLMIGALPIMYISKVRARRMAKFEENLPDAIDLFTRTMRAGHNIHSGLETISTETSDPIKKEFKKLMEELALGSQIEATLHNLGERVPLIDLKFFITGLILQRQTGANMVAVLENLSLLIRERLNMAAKMKAHTAQQRFSAGLLCTMPLVVGLGFWVLKPEYIKLLWTDPVGSKFLTYAIISEITGIVVIRKLANIKA
jgi:tight adherence protein B